jgi:hypothetical protein
MGPDGINCSEFLKQAGPAATETYSTFGGVPAEKYTGKASEWLKNYNAKFNNNNPNPYAIYGYEAGKVVLAAIAKAGDKADDRATVMANVMGDEGLRRRPRQVVVRRRRRHHPDAVLRLHRQERRLVIRQGARSQVAKRMP